MADAKRKVLTVVGARPQFIKAAVVSHALDNVADVQEVLVHTGQHFDYNMSQAFFDELGIPEPKVNLGISGGTHAQMTGRMMVELENVILCESPDTVLLFGDTNSTLAAALAAAKLGVPIAHVEAGARTRSMTNPEEINRICTDHIATLLMASTVANLKNLEQEGLAGRSAFVGDPMYDAFLQYSTQAQSPALTSLLDGSRVDTPDVFYYLTCHREENTADETALLGILGAMQALDAPVVYPVHPRNAAIVRELTTLREFDNVLFVEPVGYLGSVYLVNHARQVVTDSGGLQREAFFAGVKCTTVLPFEVWPETMVDNRNLLASPSEESILLAMSKAQKVDSDHLPFGDGHAASRIAVLVTDLAERK